MNWSKQQFFVSETNIIYYDNSIDPYIPENWANEGLLILEENMVIGNLVYRDFSNEIAKYGQIVHTRKPNQFKAKRKTDADGVLIQPASATDIPVTLNQHFHTSFMIMDGEETVAFQDLVTIFLKPAVLSIAQAIDKVLIGQGIHFRQYNGGGLMQLNSTNAGDYLIDTREKLNINKCPQDENRHLILSTVSESSMLKDPSFTEAYRVGDDGTALREASLGRKFGFNIFMAQNTPYVPGGRTTTSTLVNNLAGYTGPTSTIAVDATGSAIAAGTWLTIGGDNTPLQVATNAASGATSIALYMPTTNPVADEAIVTFYTPGAINLTGGYPVKYAKDIAVDGFTVFPVIGQPISFSGNNASVYSIIDTDPVNGFITVDRPLDNAISNNDIVCPGPSGSYNFAFHQQSLALVTRPLALPREGMGALSANVDFNNLSMRVVMTYQGQNQGTLVTLDLLMGVAVLEPLKGALLLG